MGIPLYSHDPDVHDTIVGKVGAYSRLEDSLALMAAAGARVELRTVLTSLNHKSLAWLAHHVTRHVPFAETWAIMQLENIGYGRLNWNRLFVDTGKISGTWAALLPPPWRMASRPVFTIFRSALFHSLFESMQSPRSATGNRSLLPSVPPALPELLAVVSSSGTLKDRGLGG